MTKLPKIKQIQPQEHAQPPSHTFLSLITIGDFHHSYGKSPKKRPALTCVYPAMSFQLAWFLKGFTAMLALVGKARPVDVSLVSSVGQ